MNKIQKAFGIGALVLTLFGAGCEGVAPTPFVATYIAVPTDVERTVISGYPVSIAQNYAHTNEEASAVIVAAVIDVNGNYVLASGSCDSDSALSCVEAVALIQSEIDDRDNEKIYLAGYYRGDGVFRIETIEANGLLRYIR